MYRTTSWLALSLLVSASPSFGFINYRALGGGPAGDAMLSKTTPPATLNGGAPCPPPGTPDSLCTQFTSSAELIGRGLTLRSRAFLARHDAAAGFGTGQLTYADTQIEMYGTTGSVLPPVGFAVFNFSLHGTISTTQSVPDIQTVAVGRGTLTADKQYAVQCVGTFCPPIMVPITSDPVDRTVWNPERDSFSLNLRADVGILAPAGLAGWDAEALAAFEDTFTLDAIEIQDADHQTIAGASLTIPDADGLGNALDIPTTPLATTTTTTTLPGIVTHPVAGKLLVLKDKADASKRSGRFLTNDSTLRTIGLDPLAGGAELRLFGPSTTQRDTWAMPASGWSATKKGFKYVDRAGVKGPVTAAALTKTKLAVTANGAGLGYVLRGMGPQHGIAVAVVFPASSTAVCTVFPGATGVVKKDDPAKGIFSAMRAEAPATCEALAE
jgi:hypothetical protein